MKKHYLILLLSFFAFGCSETNSQNPEALKKEILNKLKVEFIKNLPNPSISEDENGNFFIQQDETTISLFKDRIFLGNLDEDGETDIVYTILMDTGGNIEESLHGVVITSLNKEIEFKLDQNSSIIGIVDKNIIVKSYKWAKDDARCCPSIVIKKKYSFIGNKIVEIK